MVVFSVVTTSIFYFLLFLSKKLFQLVHYFIHLNLAISLFVGYLVFVTGIQTARHSVVRKCMCVCVCVRACTRARACVFYARCCMVGKACMSQELYEHTQNWNILHVVFSCTCVCNKQSMQVFSYHIQRIILV